MVDEAGEAEKGNNGGGLVCCRLLAATSQVGCVLGRGGKIVEKIRHESGAHVRVLPRDQIPPCASPGDELIQVMNYFFFLFFFLLACIEIVKCGYFVIVLLFM